LMFVKEEDKSAIYNPLGLSDQETFPKEFANLQLFKLYNKFIQKEKNYLK